MENVTHWTESGIEAFIQRVTFDFTTQLEKKMESQPDVNQSALARQLNVSEGAVSQVLNGPRNLTLKTMVRYARALGMKLAVVAYDDNDPENRLGPVNSDIFRLCWERADRPRTFRPFRQHSAAHTLTVKPSGVGGASGFGKLQPVNSPLETTPDVNKLDEMVS